MISSYQNVKKRKQKESQEPGQTEIKSLRIYHYRV